MTVEEKQEVLTFKIKKENEGKRIDQFLSSVYPEFSRSYYQNLIKKGNVLKNDLPVKKPSSKIKEGEEYTLIIPPPEKIDIVPENIPLDIYYEDEDLAVIYKPPNMVVHPSPGHTKGTVVNALLYHFKNVSEYGGRERAGIVHRLDKDTAGLMLVAKSEFAHKELQKQFQDRVVDKRYKAIVTGIVKKDYGLINFPIGRSIHNRQKMGIHSNSSRDALTEYWVEKRSEKENLTLVDIKIHTGRTHQIRVHFSAIGHPLLNDKVYGFKMSQLKTEGMKEIIKNMKYHALIAYKIGFYHPRNKEYKEFMLNKLPEPLNKIKEKL
jgi:23S rRNA pseudouridine1911/1915/1917 synthase